MPPGPASALQTWLHHLQDEADAAFLYRELAAAEAYPERQAIYLPLADVEDRHVATWRTLLAEHGHQPRQVLVPHALLGDGTGEKVGAQKFAAAHMARPGTHRSRERRA